MTDVVHKACLWILCVCSPISEPPLLQATSRGVCWRFIHPNHSSIWLHWNLVFPFACVGCSHLSGGIWNQHLREGVTHTSPPPHRQGATRSVGSWQWVLSDRSYQVLSNRSCLLFFPLDGPLWLAWVLRSFRTTGGGVGRWQRSLSDRSCQLTISPEGEVSWTFLIARSWFFFGPLESDVFLHLVFPASFVFGNASLGVAFNLAIVCSRSLAFEMAGGLWNRKKWRLKRTI